MFFGLLRFSGSLATMANVSSFTTFLSLNNQPCMTWPTLIGLNPDEYNQGLHCYPFIISLNGFNGRFNTLDDPSVKIYVSNKTEEVNLKNL